MRRMALAVLVPTVAAIAGACSFTVPTTPPLEPRPTLGPADQALARFDPTDLVKQVKGGLACRGAVNGGWGSDDNLHRAWVLTCPLVGDDRTVYFLLAEAIDAELARIATVPGSGSELGNVPDPLWKAWEIRGNAYVGTLHALGVNGNGSLSIFLNLDLLVP